jgi:hypothetical protein
MIMRFLHITLGVALLATSMVTAQVAADSELYQTILDLDATYFNAYNTCDLATQASLMSDELEFYHDQGGLSTSKPDILKSIEKNICGKVTRELVAESLEVHEIPGFGAVEIGYHKFYNNQEPDALSKPTRFITIWNNTDGIWKMHRIISLH